MHSGDAHRSTFIDVSEETAAMIAALQIKLNQKLGPEYISQRPGPGGGPKLTYVEGWKIINLANEVFGFNGWSSSIVSLVTDFADYNEETRRYSVGVTAIVRVTLRDGVFHEDTGYGSLENSKSKGAAMDKCKKEAVTDAIKRALRNFGNLMGNCLYDKQFAQEIVKVKVEPVRRVHMCFSFSLLLTLPSVSRSSSTPMTSIVAPSSRNQSPRQSQ
ncbi:Rad52/22 family double-strand break repair protein-domain-containing protein [Pterulicium gracile]|uniref:Rad52/22 family double-strand break repair protein-domain-containing protein n=1 Tax=Pterulicium gracile TaxID=1884261 RepID=A0A5C3QHT6_9AGAR|nr:Rad52/22 family double-strand break repair protein-domain-containing protein [Pterula gracilis]